MTTTTIETVPFVDLSMQRDEVAQVVREGFDRVLRNMNFVLGDEVAAFESEYASFCGARHAAGVGNGTDAIEIALAAAEIGAGDEIIVPANTFVASAEAVARSGARVVLADSDENFLIDPSRVSEVVTPRTRAVLAVHLYGQTAPVEALRAVVGEDVLIIEDAAQAQGAARGRTRAGALGDIACFSFYPGKNLGAYGDAGAVVTDDDQLAGLVRAIRNHGGERRYEHRVMGWNSRLDTLQAVVLSAKLPYLDGWNQQRRDAAAVYEELLADQPGVTLPETLSGNTHVHHLYVVGVEDRDRVLVKLAQSGIGTGVHYPRPVHLQPSFSFLGQGAGSFPTAEHHADRILSLPMYPGVTPAQQERVAEVLTRAVS